MTFRCRCVCVLATASLIVPSVAAAQGKPPEIGDLQRRVAVIRAEMPKISLAAEKVLPVFARPGSARLLVSRRIDPSFYLEFLSRAGGPPDTGDADDSAATGVALLPVRHWAGTGFGIATVASRWEALQRAVITIGPALDRPSMPLGDFFLDNGAWEGSRDNALSDGVANLALGWTLYAEIVSAASRAGWQPGILLSVLAPGADVSNADVQFRMPTRTAPPPVAAGLLGAAYLTALDSMLDFMETPAHQAQVDQSVARLRAARAAGRQIFVGSCGHYLLEEVSRDTLKSPFIPIDFRREMTRELARHRAARGDMVVWFGYGGYDCPNAHVAAVFLAAGLQVVLVSDRPPDPLPQEVVATISLSWKAPDAVVTIPFAPGHVAPLSSVEMTLHYAWLRRLLVASQ